MQENIDKMHQRGERLVDLQGKTGKIAPLDPFLLLTPFKKRGFASNRRTF